MDLLARSFLRSEHAASLRKLLASAAQTAETSLPVLQVKLIACCQLEIAVTKSMLKTADAWLSTACPSLSRIMSFRNGVTFSNAGCKLFFVSQNKVFDYRHSQSACL